MKEVISDVSDAWETHTLPKMSAKNKIELRRSVDPRASSALSPLPPSQMGHQTLDPLRAPPPSRTFEKRSPPCSVYMRYAVINQTNLSIQNSLTLQRLAEPTKTKTNSNHSFLMSRLRPLSVSSCMEL